MPVSHPWHGGSVIDSGRSGCLSCGMDMIVTICKTSTGKSGWREKVIYGGCKGREVVADESFGGILLRLPLSY